MSGKFTPGPWTAREDEGTDWLITAPDVECPDSPWNVAVVVGACGYANDPRTGSTEGNARLIASAPAMHAALTALDGWWTEEWPEGPDGSYPERLCQLAEDTKELWRQIRAALALSHPLEEKS